MCDETRFGSDTELHGCAPRHSVLGYAQLQLPVSLVHRDRKNGRGWSTLRGPRRQRTQRIRVRFDRIQKEIDRVAEVPT